VKYFLIVYSRSSSKTLSLRAFDGYREAAAERLKSELEHRKNLDIEVVVLQGEQEEDLRRTHARYFATGQEMVDSLMAALG
jgi:hypothetical protein